MLMIRNGTQADIPAVMDIYRASQEAMIRSGNTTQWGRTYPDEKIVQNDVQSGASRVVTGTEHGIFRAVIAWCKGRAENIRIDTHRDNAIMQSLIEKNGFVRCGIIRVADGSERIAYQWVRRDGNFGG